jgi:hypothetical protein
MMRNSPAAAMALRNISHQFAGLGFANLGRIGKDLVWGNQGEEGMALPDAVDVITYIEIVDVPWFLYSVFLHLI